MARSSRPIALVVAESPGEDLYTLFMAMVNWDCEVVGSCKKAMARLRQSRFDVVISDYDLPDTNGLHLVCRMRQESITLPAIIMSEDEATLALVPKALLNVCADDALPHCRNFSAEGTRLALKTGSA